MTSTNIDNFLDTVISKHYNSENFPIYINRAVFYRSMREELTNGFREQKRNGCDRTKVWLGIYFLCPFVYVDPGACDLMNYYQSDDEFYISVPIKIWELL